MTLEEEQWKTTQTEMWVFSALKRWQIVSLLAILPILSTPFPLHWDYVYDYDSLEYVGPHYHDFQPATIPNQIHVHSESHQPAPRHKFPKNNLKDFSKRIEKLPQLNNSVQDRFKIVDINGIAVNRVSIERQGILGSTSFGLLGAIGVGFVSYFQSPLASTLQSISLRNTPLEPLSFLLDIAVAALEGKCSG